ncbi:hypothetical protein OG693_39110 (plasmid) [Streptomyces sp. NBC_01259]|uniref:hypothetical protein n=1 Tax=Streptomyces sp. NBC_01259 TaxID=2903800 RepID=UPI002F90ECFC
MPTSPDLRTQLQAAAAHLHTGGEPAPELAEYVRKVMLPGGWKELRDTDTAGSDNSLPIPVAERYRSEILTAAEQQKVTITSVVNEGFEKYLAGEFKPRPRAKGAPQLRGRRTAGEKQVNLNVRPNAALHGQVRESGVLPVHVALDYLMFRFNVGPYAPGYVEPLLSGADRNPSMPRVIRDQIRDKAAELGHIVHQDMNEGFQKYLAGEYAPVAPEWPESADMAPLKVRPNNDLFDQVKVAARTKSPGLRPIQIGLAYVMDKYGIDPADAAE